MSRAANKLIKAAAGAGGDTGDDDFANVVLLLDGDGTNGAQNETFTDSSTNGFTVTQNGSVTQGSVSPYGDNWSVYFDDSAGNQYLQIADSPTFDATTSLCIEAWFYMTSAPGDGPNEHAIVNKWVSTTPGQRTIFIGVESTGLRVYADIQGASNPVLITTDGGAISQNEWHHVAVTWDGSTYRAFLDGVLEGSTSNSNAPVASSQVVRVGYNTNTHYFGGYISNVRWVTNGGAIYTSDFTPPTSPLTAISGTALLLNSSNKFKDESTNNHTVTINGSPKVTPFSPFKNDDARTLATDGGSAYFDLATSYLTYSGGGSSVSDITISFWVYVTGSMGPNGGQYPRIFSSAAGALLIYLRSDDIRIYNGGERIQTPINANQWYYFVAQRTSNTWEMWLDGVSKGTASDSTSINLNTTNYIGRDATNAGYFGGYLSDFKITEGSEGYSGTFTPPTSPVSAGSSDLLLNFQDAGIYDRSGINNLDTIGQAQIDTAVVKYGTGSMQFDGSGDYLLIDDENAEYFQINNADFTAEFWANGTANGIQIFCGSGTISNTSASNWWIETVSGVMRIYISNGSSYTVISDTVAFSSYSGWVHVAFVNSSGTSALYMNGTRKATATTPSTNTATCPFWVGGSSSGYVFNGYIDDLRVSKGIARYTGASFTPPDAELPKF